MIWILVALLIAGFYAFYHFFIKISSGEINMVLGAVILQITAALVSLSILGYLKFTYQEISFSIKGAQYAILAGVFVSLAEITYFYLLSKGANISLAMPVVLSGSLVFGIFLGILVLGEHLKLVHALAILLIFSGIALLSY